jgi:hypothetical protein
MGQHVSQQWYLSGRYMVCFRCTQDTQCPEEVTSNTCNMLLTLGTSNSREYTAALKYALRYPLRCHPDANMFLLPEQLLHEIGFVTPTAHVNAGSSRTVRTPANDDAVIAAGKREPWRSSCDMSPRVLEVLHVDQLHPYHSSRGGTSVSRRLSYAGAIFGSIYDIKTLQISSHYITYILLSDEACLRLRVCWTSTTTVTSGHGVNLMLFLNVGINFPFKRQRLRCIRLGHSHGSLFATWQADRSTLLSFSGRVKPVGEPGYFVASWWRTPLRNPPKGTHYWPIDSIFNKLPLFMHQWEEENAVLYPVEVPPP